MSREDVIRRVVERGIQNFDLSEDVIRKESPSPKIWSDDSARLLEESENQAS